MTVIYLRKYALNKSNVTLKKLLMAALKKKKNQITIERFETFKYSYEINLQFGI